jgi:hypothetical protein
MNRCVAACLLGLAVSAWLAACDRPPMSVAPATPALAQEIGRRWTDVEKALQAQRAEVTTQKRADGGTDYFPRRLDQRFGNLGFSVNDQGIIDSVEAFEENALRPHYQTVIGPIAPGVPVAEIEKQLGKPIYVEYGRHGLRMKGWLVGDYLAFVESNNGMYLTPEVGRVRVFRKDFLPPTERMWSLKGRTTLEALARGEPHVETGLGKTE